MDEKERTGLTPRRRSRKRSRPSNCN